MVQQLSIMLDALGVSSITGVGVRGSGTVNSNPSSQEAEAGRLRIQGQPGQLSEILSLK